VRNLAGGVRKITQLDEEEVSFRRDKTIHKDLAAPSTCLLERQKSHAERQTARGDEGVKGVEGMYE